MTYVIWHLNCPSVAHGVGGQQAVCGSKLVEELEPCAWLQDVDVVYCINIYASSEWVWTRSSPPG